jgi:hypothetical protein
MIQMRNPPVAAQSRRVPAKPAFGQRRRRRESGIPAPLRNRAAVARMKRKFRRPWVPRRASGQL